MRLCSRCDQRGVVGSTAGVFAVEAGVPGELVQFLAARRRIFCVNAGLAQARSRQVDAAGDGFSGQIFQAVGAESFGHGGLDFWSHVAAVEKLRSEQFVDRRHVDSVKARSDDGRAGDSDVQFANLASLSKL